MRSEDVQEILNHVPNWMIRWGITIIFILIFLGAFVSWLIQYPDVVQGKLKLTTVQPPSTLVSQVDGYIEALLVENGEQVYPKQVIAEIKNTVSSETVDSLKSILEETNLEKAINDLQKLSDAGSLQDNVNTLYDNMINFYDVMSNDYFEKNLQTLTKQMTNNNRLAEITQEELKLLTIEVSNASEKFEDDSLLYEKNVIAKHSFFSKQSDYLLKRQELVKTKKEYVQYQIIAANYERRRLELEKTISDQKRQFKILLESSKKSLKSAIENWKADYALITPIEGSLAYLSNISVQQYVKVQQPLFSIIPKGNNIIGIIQITDNAFGKVHINQRVNMKLKNYPYYEFGQIEGKVIEISSMPSGNGYFVKVGLTNGLTTTYNKRIEYKPEMSGTGGIITEDLRLIERIFNSFRKVFDD